MHVHLYISFLLVVLGKSQKYDLPNKLILKLGIKNLQTKTFHIFKESTIDDENIAVITTTQKQWHPKKKKFVGNYKDRKGSFSVSMEVSRKNGNWIKKFFGFFFLGNKQYSLKPADQNIIEKAFKTHNVDIGGITHVVSETQNNFNFENSIDSRKLKKRAKRSASNQGKRVLVEVLVVLDYTIYKSWYDVKNHNLDETIYGLLSYYSQIIAEVDRKYKSITTGKYTYSVKMAGLYVTETLQDSITELNPVMSQGRIDFRFALDEIPHWVSTKKGKLPAYDVLVLFTKYKSINGYSGYGLIGSTCRSSSNSISTDKGIRDTSDLVAHEIAHNLGAEHDGDENHCSPDEQYLMTPIHLPNQENKLYAFSSCTIKYFDEHVSKEENHCLFEKENEPITTLGGVGKVESVDDQCKHTKGPHSYFCTRNKEEDEQLCSELHCYDKVLGGCVDAGYGAFERTPCGDNKWCIKNECVDVFLITEDCPYGDEYNNCEYLKSSCGDVNVLQHCCATCRSMKDPTTPDCLYGDSINACASSPHQCWDFDWRAQCCRTCAKLKNDNPECPYGDYFSDCKSAGRNCDDAYIRSKCCRSCASETTFFSKFV